MLVRNRGYRLNEGISNPLFLKLGLDLSRSKLYRYRNKLDCSDFILFDTDLFFSNVRDDNSQYND